jgi:tetratricopeptide (TPR) repeat protein
MMRYLKFLVGLCLAGIGVLEAQEVRLGRINFPTSGSAAAQDLFVRGVLYLHSFEYQSAREAFREAQEVDPSFAMAYWGEAMTRNHPVWNRRYRAQALAALTKLGATPEARLATAPTERERMYLQAVETLFADGPKAKRDTAYMYAMHDLSLRYPEDLEAQAFYALSLLGLNQGVRDYSSYMKAGALAEDVRRVNADHPGGAHYVIHSFDDALHAPLGLQAAWAYSDIAPAAPHAMHMTSHIFLALGMWDQVVERNETAVELTHRGPGHYTAWLNYGLIQQGRYTDAVDLLVVAWANLPDDARLGQRSYLAGMRAQYIFGSERWDDQVMGWEIEVTDASRSTRAINAFTRGYAALKLGRRETAGHFLGELGAIADEPGEDETPNAAAIPRILQLELEAMLTYDAGLMDEALLAARKATQLEDALPLEFGPPDIVKPSHELMGEMLLAFKRPTEASREFQAALLLAPKRSLSLLGLSMAAAQAGDVRTAARAAAQLDLVWHRADPEARDRLSQQ